MKQDIHEPSIDSGISHSAPSPVSPLSAASPTSSFLAESYTSTEGKSNDDSQSGRSSPSTSLSSCGEDNILQCTAINDILSLEEMLSKNLAVVEENFSLNQTV